MKKLLSFFLVLIFSFSLMAQFPDNVTELNVTPNNEFSVKGNLSQGEKIDDLSWASSSSVACFPGTQNTKFRGNHVLYSMELPPYSELTITVIPDDKSANFSLYAYQIGSTNYSTVPDLNSCVTCEADYKWDYPKRGQTQDHSRHVYLNAIKNPYNVVIGVVGAEGLETGGYTLQIDLKTKIDNSDKQQPLKMYTAKSEKGKILTYGGDLSEGVIIYDLSWAANSSVACFPATQNDKFSGNQIIYITEIPAHSEMDITVVPDDEDANFSIWAYMVGTTNDAMVPNLTSCVTCEAEYKWDYPKKGKTQDHTRTVHLNAISNPYRVVIGVAGADGLTTGKFKLKISVK
ncbi:MAG: hypothetical protein JXL97_04505 [Bacteroidales bacterium]|nr:hypothetical protein [Bacteroidales bacterium]